MGNGKGRSKEVDSYVAGLRPDLREIVGALRDLIFEAAPDIEEELKSGHPSYSLEGTVCDIVEVDGKVFLGFLKGVGLNDPEGLLHGTGKRYREAQIDTLEDVNRERLKALIKGAVQLNLREL